MRITTLADLFNDAEARSTDAQIKMIAAYKGVFGGTATKEEAEIVLVDILKATGYYNTTPEGATSMALHEAEGARRVGAFILSRLSVDLDKLRSAGSAVGREGRLDNMKGTL